MRQPTMGLTPHYRHDCDQCVFAGHYLGHDIWDAAHDGYDSMIVRYSSTVSHYQSGKSLLLCFDGGEEWLYYHELPSLRERIERDLRRPSINSAVRNGARGHPTVRPRISALAERAAV